MHTRFHHLQAQSPSPLPDVKCVHTGFWLRLSTVTMSLTPMTPPGFSPGNSALSLRWQPWGPSLYANAKPQLPPSFLSSLIDCFPSLLGLRNPWSTFRRDLPPHCPASPTGAPGTFNLVTFPPAHWGKTQRGAIVSVAVDVQLTTQPLDPLSFRLQDPLPPSQLPLGA